MSSPLSTGLIVRSKGSSSSSSLVGLVDGVWIRGYMEKYMDGNTVTRHHLTAQEGVVRRDEMRKCPLIRRHMMYYFDFIILRTRTRIDIDIHSISLSLERDDDTYTHKRKREEKKK